MKESRELRQIPEPIRTIQSRYDYWAWWLWLEIKGKNIYGPLFKLYEEDAEIVLKILAWCVKDTETAQKLEIDLGKGIMLAGREGRGKTSLMNIVRHILPPAHRHRMKPCREIAMDYARDGYESLQLYTKLSFAYGGEPVAVCFDDLGLEAVVQYYGNPCNVMAEILLSRYDYFVYNHMLTHVTTNLTSQELEDRYTRRVRSRCREMFNFLTFSTNSPDKRK